MVGGLNQEQKLMQTKKNKIGKVNWLGLGTLFFKENKRFFKVYQQTILAPAFITLLFFLVINIAIKDRVNYDYVYIDFLAPGLIVMAMMQNAFANTSSSLLSSKIAGNIVDLLMPPLSANEIIIAYTSAAVIRAILVGFITFILVMPFANFTILNIYNVILFSILGTFFLSLVGLIAGIWAEKFDNMSGITNFIITPLTFLSGTFYDVKSLPEPFYTVSLYNPFYYVIDGFRNGFINTESNVLVYGIYYLIMLNITLYIICFIVLKKGWMLKP